MRAKPRIVPPKQPTTWILVGDESGAKVFTREKGAASIRLLSEMPNEAGRTRNRDINSDRPGRAFSRMGGKRHALSTHESPHEREVADFAREVCARLKKARLDGDFERLVLVAAPRMLGLLRSTIDDPTSALIVETLDKDLANTPAQDLMKYLRDKNIGR